MSHIIRRALVIPALFFLTSAEAFELSGTVLDSSEEPVSGATVWLSQNRFVHKTETDGAGHFAFDNVSVDIVLVAAWKQGYAVGGFEGVATGPATTSITLVEPGTVVLRVVNEKYEPVRGARVEMMLVNGAYHVPVVDLAPQAYPASSSDEAGRIEIPLLPKDGAASLTISHRDYASSVVPYAPVGKERIPVQLVPGPVVEGRVTNEESAGIDRARVFLYVPVPEGQDRIYEALTGPEGFYRIMLPAWSASADGLNTTATHPRHASAARQSFALHPDGLATTLNLTLPGAHAVQGRVVGPDNEPAQGVSLAYLVDDFIRAETLSSGDGGFRLRAPAVEGRVHVFAPDGMMPANADDHIVHPGDGSNTVLSKAIRLVEIPEVTGTVRGADGALSPHVLVTSVEYGPGCWAITDDAGKLRIRLPRMPEDRTARFVAEHGRRFQRAEFSVSFAKLKPVKVKLDTFLADVVPCRSEQAPNNLQILRDEPAPELVCRQWFNTNSDELTLKKLRGRVVVLTLADGFGNTPSNWVRTEELKALHRLFQDVEDVAVVTVLASDARVEELEEAIELAGIRFPVGCDEEALPTFDAYDVTMVPQTVLIDKKGVLRYYDIEGRLLELVKALRREG